MRRLGGRIEVSGINAHFLSFFKSIIERLHKEVKFSWFYFHRYMGVGFALVRLFFQDVEKGLGCSVALSLSQARC